MESRVTKDLSKAEGRSQAAFDNLWRSRSLVGQIGQENKLGGLSTIPSVSVCVCVC